MTSSEESTRQQKARAAVYCSERSLMGCFAPPLGLVKGGGGRSTPISALEQILGRMEGCDVTELSDWPPALHRARQTVLSPELESQTPRTALHRSHLCHKKKPPRHQFSMLREREWEGGRGGRVAGGATIRQRPGRLVAIVLVHFRADCRADGEPRICSRTLMDCVAPP